MRAATILTIVLACAPPAGKEPRVNLADQSFGHGCARVEIVRDQVKCVAIIQQLPNVVGVGLRHRLPGQQLLGLGQRQVRALDVGRVMGFQQQRPFAHLAHPLLGKLSRLQKAAGTLDLGQPLGHRVSDREVRFHASTSFSTAPPRPRFRMPVAISVIGGHDRFHPPHTAIFQHHLDAVRVRWAARQDARDNPCGHCAAALILFFHDLDLQTGSDVTAER